jgi:predicted Zn-dependent peptidase
LWPAPPFHAPGDAELDVAAAILSDPHGRLQRELVEKGLAVSVSAHENSLRRGSAFVVSALVDGPSADYVARVIARVVRDLAREVGPDECRRASEEWQDAMLLRLETSAGRAQQLASSLEAERADRWDLSRYGKIQPAGVEQALRAMLAGRQAVVVVHQDRHYRPRGVVVERRAEAR